MATQGISYGNINELIFENRFRQYGAYMLRKTYSDRLFIAALTGISVIVLLIATPLLLNYFREDVFAQPVLDTQPLVVEREVEMVHEKKPDIPKDAPKPKEPVKGVSNNMIVTNDPNKNTVNLTNDSMVAGDPNADPNKNKPNDIPDPDPNKNKGNGNVEEDNTVHSVAEENPEATCNISQHIAHNLAYPAFAKDAGIQGTVYVSFVVDKNGDVTDVKVVKDIGYGCGEAAIKAVKSMCKWKPGKMGGKPVKVQCNLPIKFSLH